MNKKLAVVTGVVENGIGQAIGKRLVQDGFEVVGTRDVNSEVPDGNFENEGITIHTVDHSDLNSLEAFIEKHLSGKTVDAFVNVQMHFQMETPVRLDAATWDTSTFINFSMPPLMVNRLQNSLSEGASIVFVTSTEGFLGSYGATSYAASKAALHNIVKSLANLLGPRGIRANAIAPGWIGGVMDTDEIFNMSRQITPLQRLGNPEEVASVASFLCGRDASFVSGTTIVVDGGYTGADTIAKYEFEQG